LGLGGAGCSLKPDKDTIVNKLSDSQLGDKLRESLASDPDLRTVSVEADAGNNQVRLYGIVDTQEARFKALTLAKGAIAGIVVVDELSVEPGALERLKVAAAAH
jgi:osmotically-inducible protein OsmY